MNNKLKLTTLSSSTDSVVHLAVHINSIKDNGVLYLTKSEYDVLLPILRQGCFEHGTEFEEQDDRFSQQYDHEY